MKLLREVTAKKPVEDGSSTGPVAPEDGWNVGHLANHGILLSCDGFSMKLDLDQLNALFDLVEDGESGEVRDHRGDAVYVEVLPDQLVLSRQGDTTYPQGVIVDLKTLKELGIEPHAEEQPEEDDGSDEEDATIDAEGPEEELKEGVKKAFRRSGKKIKRGFRVTSGFRKGRVVASVRGAYKPRAKARTRMKLKIASRKKRLVRIMKAKRTRMKPLSKRLARMNKR